MELRPETIVSALIMLVVSTACAGPPAEIRQDLSGFTGDAFGVESYERLHWDNILQNKLDESA